jgi:hypothetical protein
MSKKESKMIKKLIKQEAQCMQQKLLPPHSKQILIEEAQAHEEIKLELKSERP